MDSVATYGYNVSSAKKEATPSHLTQSPLKLVFVGDPCVGKTSLLYSYQKGEYHDNEHCHTSVLEGFTKSVVVENSEFCCLLWDTLCSSEFDSTDCFVICYAVNDLPSLKNIQSKWIPEIRLHSPDVPFVIVGTKKDLRETTEGPDLIAPEQVQNLNQESTDYFLECSAKDQESIENLCKVCVRVIFEHQQKSKAHSTANSQSLCVIS